MAGRFQRVCARTMFREPLSAPQDLSGPKLGTGKQPDGVMKYVFRRIDTSIAEYDGLNSS